ncbi:MAG: hypothetical protein FGM14_11305 [Flavobacteriales bacterium]|nr:hypothetical protein [Flavobacteriales bacterium]
MNVKIRLDFSKANRFISKIILGISLLLFVSCSVPKMQLETTYVQREITTKAGPEDIVLDTMSTNFPRLIISCDNRRTSEKSGFIQAMDLKTEAVIVLERTNEPANLVFHPHGIDVVKLKDGTSKLYVVNHNEAAKEQSILIYRIVENQLVFEKQLIDKLLVSPNDVAGDESGKIYTGNEFYKRNALLSALLGLKNGYFIQFDGKQFSKRETKFCYANGVAVYKNQLLTVGSRNRFLYKAPLDFKKDSKKEKITKIKGADNISVIGDKAYIACHVKLLKFVKHAKSAVNKSPTVIYEVDLLTNEKRLIYTNTNGAINGATTAILYNGNLYLSQVFEPYILVVEKVK